MPVIRIALLFLVIGGLVLFAFSNLSPVLPLVFLGMKTPVLPLAAWIGIAIASGAITSFFLQSLSYMHWGYSTQTLEERDYVPSRSRSFRRESPEEPAPEPQTRYAPPPPETPTKRDGSDWEERVDEDWDFDEESAAPTSYQQDFERDRSMGTPHSERSSYEVKQEPKTASQTGSVYSYSYRESTESGVGRTDAVYDANYRVITPPLQKTPDPEEDDDWGFGNEEDFDDEGDRKQGKR